MELSLRRVLQTFRLAGVESQAVTRILEGFGEVFYQQDASKLFVDSEEAYEMAYLMIVMQTTLHNPNIKMKLQAKDFILQGKTSCPKSYDSIGDQYMQTLYDNVKSREIYSPLSRSWYDEGFNESDLTMCNIKLCSIPEG